jgi:hypothetical protein
MRHSDMASNAELKLPRREVDLDPGSALKANRRGLDEAAG